MPYTPYNGGQISIGPGTLYAAPLGTAEPTSASGTWGTGWQKLGYTAGGSTFSSTATSSPVTPEEEIYAVRNTVTDMTADLTFNLAELTASNLLLALNAGTGTGVQATSYTTLSDGSIKVEPPDPGNEARIMLGWDAVSNGGAPTDPGYRLIVRQCFQTGNLSIARVKGNTLTTFACTFSAEKPAGLQPFAFIFGAGHLGYLSA
jgi:hypothetical protein